MTVYPNKNTISLFTDFRNIEKGFSKKRSEININEFNKIEYKKIKIAKRKLEYQGDNWEVRLINDKIKDDEIYILNDFGYFGQIKATIFNNEYDLSSIWNYDIKYQHFIHNKTDKYLYLETKIYYLVGIFPNKKGGLREIAPNQIISLGALPTYIFENKPPESITMMKGTSETTVTWLRRKLNIDDLEI